MRLLTVNIVGSIGDQLFQIAAAHAYAKEHLLDLVMPDSWNKSDLLRDTFFDSKIFTLIPKEQYISINWHTVEKYFEFPKGFPFYKLKGKFQEFKYFSKYSSEIKHLFQISNTLENTASDILREVGINDPDGWIACLVYNEPPTYYLTARETIQSKIGLRAVCWITNDTESVYKNLYKEGDKVINEYQIKQLACLSLFPYIIMSNVSLCWWATWLNPKNYSDRIICYPKTLKIYEDEWLKIII